MMQYLFGQANMSESMNSENIKNLYEKIKSADAIFIGAGSGLSTSAGYDYGARRLIKYFPDFIKKYNFKDLYSAGFYSFPTYEEYFAYWSRMSYINRYVKDPKPVYKELYELVKDKNYFVITTNVDHCFQKAGFNKQRLFYTQGDMGLWQCSTPCHQSTYDNENNVRQCLLSQGFTFDQEGELIVPDESNLKMQVPTELVPLCPKCGKPMRDHLRSDSQFVQDEGWYAAQTRYNAFVKNHTKGKVLYLDLGSGGNTPIIFKIPFMRMVHQNPEAIYATINLGEAITTEEIADRSICLNADIGAAVSALLKLKEAKA